MHVIDESYKCIIHNVISYLHGRPSSFIEKQSQWTLTAAVLFSFLQAGFKNCGNTTQTLLHGQSWSIFVLFLYWKTYLQKIT